MRSGQNLGPLLQGDTWSFEIDIDDNSDGTPADLSGATAHWWLASTARPGPNSIVLAAATVQNSMLALVKGADNRWRIEVSLPPTITSAIEPSDPPGYYHEAKVVEADGRVSRVATGLAMIKASLNL